MASNEEILAQATEILIQAANDCPGIKAIYLFGSRVTGDYRRDSDLDVAIEVQWAKGMGVVSGPVDIWFQLGPQLRKLIDPNPFSIVLDLQCYIDATETPTVDAGIQEGSIRIFPARSATPSSKVTDG